MALVGFLLLFSTGCEEDITAVTGTGMPYSLYGVLTPQADTQFVRVYSIDDVLAPIPSTPLDAHFASRNLQTGEERVWADSILQEEDGMFAHVFWSPFAATYGHPYTLIVERSDGVRSHVEATVPPLTQLVLPDPLEQAPSLLDARIIGAAPNLIRIEVIYDVKYVENARIQKAAYLFKYDGAQRSTEEGWRISIKVATDLRGVLRALQEETDIETSLGVKPVFITLKLIVANAEWIPPGGSLAPEILVQPDALSNVHNGFGFVGAGYRLEATWMPTDTLLLGR